jgi:hypothetical protein
MSVGDAIGAVGRLVSGYLSDSSEVGDLSRTPLNAPVQSPLLSVRLGRDGSSDGALPWGPSLKAPMCFGEDLPE